MTKQGVTAIFETTGNPHSHLILRGGNRTGPNYSASILQDVLGDLNKHQLKPYLIVDCSHGNSEKDYTRQAAVAQDLAKQITDGQGGIAGIMLRVNWWQDVKIIKSQAPILMVKASPMPVLTSKPPKTFCKNWLLRSETEGKVSHSIGKPQNQL